MITKNKILRPLFYWPFRLVTKCEAVPFEPLKSLHLDEHKLIVYITVSSSLANLMCIERLTQRLGLPSPFEDINIAGTCIPRTCCLKEPGWFTIKGSKTLDVNPIFKQWDEFSQKTGLKLQIIPMTVLWSRNPGYEKTSLRGVNATTPAFRKFFNMIFSGRDNCTIVSDVIDLDAFKARYKKSLFSRDLNRTFRLVFVNIARSVIGKPLPNRQMIIEEILRQPAIANAIDKQIKENGGTTEEYREKARNILDVMVADTRYSLLRFLNGIITKIWSKIYEGQTILGVDKVRALVRTGHEIIYIPCHRSHMDYILSTFVLFHEGLPLPQIASGDNLNFFPVGPIIRRCGSYFIRRKMKGDDFYITLFREYLNHLFKYGYSTEFFIEGGRSRTGRTLPPKTGMVAMTVQSQLRGLDRPIAFVPTYLGYEHVTEVGSYMKELSGEKKKKESAKALLGIFKRYRNYGRGYVTFGDPIIVPKFLSEHVPNWQNDIDPLGIKKPEWMTETVNRLAQKIIVNLNASATINGINLCALAIINDNDHAMSMNLLERCIDLYIKLLKVDPKRHDSVPEANTQQLIQQAIDLRKFHVYDLGDDMKFVRPSHGQTLQLTYFQNNIVHLFALPALIAVIIIRNGHILRSDIHSHTRSLFYFLRHELYAPVAEEDLDNLIDKYIDCFKYEGYITQDEQMVYVSGDGYEQFYILGRSIYQSLVRYLVAVTALKNTEDNTLEVKNFVQKCIVYAKRLPVNVTGSTPDFADPIIFKIMCETFIRHSYFSLNQELKIVVNHQKVAKLDKAASPLLGAKDAKLLNGDSLIRRSDNDFT